MVQSNNWLLKGLDKALKATTGYQLVPSVIARRSNNNILKFFGISYTFADWKLPNYVDEGYSRNVALYSVINRITRTAANCPMKVYKVKNVAKADKFRAWTGQGATKESIQAAMIIKSLAYEEDNDHPLNRLIDRPNEWQGGNEFTQNSIGFKLITGNRFLFKNMISGGANEGRPLSIYNLPPQNMRIKVGGTLFEVDDYWLEGLNREPVRIPKELVLHSRYWNPNYDGAGGHLWGLSPVAAAARNVDRIAKAEERAVAMLTNAGAAGIMYNKSVESLTIEQASELRRKVNEELLGTGNAGTIAVANGELGYINFAMNAQEMQVIEAEKWSLQQICNAYGVPYVLFSSEDSSYNNIKEAKKELITMAVIPELSSLRDDWNEIAKMYGDGRYVDFDLSYYPELQEDQEKTAKIMSMSWWIKPNEKRLAMNLDEDMDEEMMNKYIVPSGLTEISDLNPDVLDDQMNEVDNQNNDDE